MELLGLTINVCVCPVLLDFRPSGSQLQQEVRSAAIPGVCGYFRIIQNTNYEALTLWVSVISPTALAQKGSRKGFIPA